MNFSRVVFAAPKGLEVVVRGTSQSVYQLEQLQGWDLTADANGVVGVHQTRTEPLFVPWAQVAHCDVLADAKPAKKAS